MLQIDWAQRVEDGSGGVSSQQSGNTEMYENAETGSFADEATWLAN